MHIFFPSNGLTEKKGYLLCEDLYSGHLAPGLRQTQLSASNSAVISTTVKKIVKV